VAAIANASVTLVPTGRSAVRIQAPDDDDSRTAAIYVDGVAIAPCTIERFMRRRRCMLTEILEATPGLSRNPLRFTQSPVGASERRWKRLCTSRGSFSTFSRNESALRAGLLDYLQNGGDSAPKNGRDR